MRVSLVINTSYIENQSGRIRCIDRLHLPLRPHVIDVSNVVKVGVGLFVSNNRKTIGDRNIIVELGVVLKSTVIPDNVPVALLFYDSFLPYTGSGLSLREETNRSEELHTYFHPILIGLNETQFEAGSSFRPARV